MVLIMSAALYMNTVYETHTQGTDEYKSLHLQHPVLFEESDIWTYSHIYTVITIDWTNDEAI